MALLSLTLLDDHMKKIKMAPRVQHGDRLHLALLRCINELQKRGLARGAVMDHNGSVCAQGAMLLSLGVDPRVDHPSSMMNLLVRPKFEQLNHMFESACGEPTVIFNDRKERTVYEVISVFRAILKDNGLGDLPQVPTTQAEATLAGGPSS